MYNAKLLIVEDDNFSRTTLAGGLSALGFQVLAATAAANQAISLINKEHPEVALLDLDLGPGPSGYDLAIVLRKHLPQLGIIFLTSYSDPRYLSSTIENLPVGARYQTKSSLTNLTQLATLINQTKNFPLKTSQKFPKSSTKLSGKQLRILKMLAEGRSSNQIATELDISIKAVEGIISRLNTNLGLSTDTSENRRVQLVRAYYRLIGKL